MYFNPVNINLTYYIEVVAGWITSTITTFQTITITIGIHTFSLFDIFTYSAAFILFVKLFVRRWVPDFDFNISAQPADVRIDSPPSLDLSDFDKLSNIF